tara:strand:- start:134 stop:688 length:555 start_codon:yes stop_codon:yes gene_type:complete
MILALAVAASAQTNCFADYVSTVGESCYFGSDSGRLSMAMAYDVFVEGCDFEACACEHPTIQLSSCDHFIVRSMIEFMGVHPHTGAPEQSLYRNVTAILKEVCDRAGPENEAPQSQLKGSHGACAPSTKPPTGHAAAITVYVTVVSLLFTFVFFGELDFVGSERRSHASPNFSYTSLSSKSTLD